MQGNIVNVGVALRWYSGGIVGNAGKGGNEKCIILLVRVVTSVYKGGRVHGIAGNPGKG